jgi:hypothetical protein
MVLSPSME